MSGIFALTPTLVVINGQSNDMFGVAAPSGGSPRTITVTYPGPPSVSITGVTVAEGNAGTVNAVFQVSLSAAYPDPVTVNYATANGTATAGADYVAASGPVETFAPGQTTKQVTVQVIGDILVEPSETFTVTLSAPNNAALGTSVATGTITDDDVLPVAVGDSYTTPFGTTLNVPAPGVLANDTGGAKTATVVASVAHGTLLLGANGSVTYTPATGYSGPDSFTYRVADGSGQGNVVAVSITVGAAAPAAVADSYSTPYQTTLTVAAPGVLANDQDVSVGVTAQLVTSVAHGALTLGANGSVSYTPAAGFSGADSFVYRTLSSAGASPAATVTINVVAPTDVQAPLELRMSSIVGNAVTFRWKVPTVGPAPTGFILEGGGAPGQTLVALPTGSAAPIFTVAAPNGSFYVRFKSSGTRGPSVASNEILLHVNQPVAPSAPQGLQATVSGSTLHLGWTPTFAGGVATGVVLDVTGTISGSVPLSAGERVSIPGAPAGSYSIRVRAVNAAGTSAATAPVVVNIPSGCTAAPEPPTNFLAYVLGGIPHLVWDPPASGEAATAYVITVPGIGAIPIGVRAISGGLPAGTYNISVQAVGACGTSTPVGQTLIVP